jgi:hypothetical protein
MAATRKFDLRHAAVLVTTLCIAGAFFRIEPVTSIALMYFVTWGVVGFGIEGDGASAVIYMVAGGLLFVFPAAIIIILLLVGTPIWAAMPIGSAFAGSIIGYANRGSRGWIIGGVVGAVVAALFLVCLLSALYFSREF